MGNYDEHEPCHPLERAKRTFCHNHRQEWVKLCALCWCLRHSNALFRCAYVMQLYITEKLIIPGNVSAFAQ
jgi:hypothetical protein